MTHTDTHTSTLNIDYISPEEYAMHVSTEVRVKGLFSTTYDRNHWSERAGDEAYDYAIDVPIGRKTPSEYAADYITQGV